MMEIFPAAVVAAILVATLPARRLPGRTLPARPRRRPVDEAMVIDLVAALISSGAAIPAALQALGECLPEGGEGREVSRAARILLLGGSWEEAWAGGSGALERLARALEPAWSEGAPPVVLLHRAAAAIRARRMKDAQEAAGRLSVRLVLPLGLCFLPAFFLIGVLPIVLSLGMKLLGSLR